MYGPAVNFNALVYDLQIMCRLKVTGARVACLFVGLRAGVGSDLYILPLAQYCGVHCIPWRELWAW